MAKQNKAKAQSDEKSRAKVKRTVVEELSDDLAGLAKLPGGPIAVVGGSTIQAQAARLGDPRLQTAQRQALAAQIGQVQGNRHLQRVMASIKDEAKTALVVTRQDEEQKETKTVSLSYDMTLMSQKEPKSVSRLSGHPRGGIIQRSQIEYFVIGDPNLNAGGGRFLATLEPLRGSLMSLQIRTPWTLVLSIHGAQNIIATQGGFLRLAQAGRPLPPGVYDAAAVTSIFSGSDFQRWRNRFGPERVVLNACQVGVPLEGAIIRAITRPPASQRAQGLGPGCRPNTEVMTVQVPGRGGMVDLQSRSQYNRLNRANKRVVIRNLSQLNRRWGYFGRPPVPDNPRNLLHFYFDEVTRNGWVVVSVSIRRQPTPIPFYNRMEHHAFLTECTQGVAQLPPRRRTTSPPVSGNP